jgi:hypothetical protein
MRVTIQPQSHQDTKKKNELYFPSSRENSVSTFRLSNPVLKELYYNLGDFVSWWQNSNK